jgi:hypothetical protein
MIFKEIDNMKDVGAICHYYHWKSRVESGYRATVKLQQIWHATGNAC